MNLITNGREIIKETVLEELAKEDVQVLGLAHLYAKYLQTYGIDITKAISTATEKSAIIDNTYKQGYYDALREMRKQKEDETKAAYCKNCKYFRYDGLVKIDEIKVIRAHEICKKWGTGCKTKEDGFCFLFEPKEVEK